MSNGLELRDAWIRAVKTLIGVSDYRVSKKFDPVFAKVSHRLASDGVDIHEFCEAQVDWVIRSGKRGVLYPTLLSGPKAWERFKEYPKRVERVNELRRELAIQVDIFQATLNTSGVEAAMNNKVAGYTPIFLWVMYKKLEVTPPQELVQDARLELHRKPLLREVLPRELLGEL